MLFFVAKSVLDFDESFLEIALRRSRLLFFCFRDDWLQESSDNL